MPEMTGMPGMAAMPSGWDAGHAAAVFGMWAAMMIVMMLPGVLPVLVARRALFGLGYFSVWTGFAAGATALQWGLERAGAVSPATALNSAPLAALAIAAIGIYQLSPLKSACLLHCRAASTRDADAAGAGTRMRSGLRHGVSCLGCCWALMLLLFVGGAMNLVWIGALTLFVLAEKIIPRPLLLARAAGVALIVFGTAARLR